MSAEIYDNGTHYVINHKLNFKMLKALSDNDDVAIEGDYTEAITGCRQKKPCEILSR